MTPSSSVTPASHETLVDRAHCEILDQRDPLAQLRQQFALPQGVIYLDGNSLGARPVKASARAQEIIQQEWGDDLIRSWNKAGWFDMPRQLGNRLAPLMGAHDDEVIVTDTTSINLFKALAAALSIQASQPENHHKTEILSERNNFPTDLYMAQGLTQWLNDNGKHYTLRLVDSPQELSAALGPQTAVLMLTHVNYRTGRMLDMHDLSQKAHAQGALTLWDLAHSVGAVPLDLHQANADFAVGCTYKYLNGGPGAPAFMWVPQKHQKAFKHPLTGWWGHAKPFAMDAEFTAAAGIQKALCGTQGIVSMGLIACGLDIFEQTTLTAVRRKSLALTDLFIHLVESRCASHPLQLVTPRTHHERGSQVSFAHPQGYAVMQALIHQQVIGDYREPQILRFGFAPLYVRHVDVWDAVEQLRVILDNELWRDPQYSQRQSVT